MDDSARVIRHAARQLWRAPLVSVASILTLAIGIGACTLMMSVVVLAVAPEIGHLFERANETPGSDHVVVLSDAVWRGRFGAIRRCWAVSSR